MKRRVAPKILVVEDDANNHPLFESVFSEVGFTVKICSSAEDDFIETVAAFAPDIISMDLMIGSQYREISRDGFQAIALLKTDERTKAIPVMVASNFFQETKVKFARSLGVIDYFNLQGQPLIKMAKRFREYVDDKKHYQPSHPAFRE